MVNKRPRSSVGRHADDGQYGFQDEIDGDMVQPSTLFTNLATVHPAALLVVTFDPALFTWRGQKPKTTVDVLQEPYEDYAEEAADVSSWSSEQVSDFFDAFQKHGQDWYKVDDTGAGV